METKQSAVNWLIDNILCDIEIYTNEDGDFIKEPKITYYNAFKSHVDLTKFVDKAREMEKQQIIDAAYHGVDYEHSPFDNAEQYYNGTYGKV